MLQWGRSHRSRSPSAGTIPFPEPHRGGSTSRRQAYVDPPRIMPDLTVPTHHQHEHRDGSTHHPPEPGVQGDTIPSSPPRLPELRRGGSASHHKASITPFQTTQDLSVVAHGQHERRGSNGDPPTTGASSDNQLTSDPAGGSDTGGGGTSQPPHHGDTTPFSYSTPPPLHNRLSHLHTRPKEPEAIIKLKGERLGVPRHNTPDGAPVPTPSRGDVQAQPGPSWVRWGVP